MNERWRLIPSLPTHEASDLGQIRVRASRRALRQFNNRGYLTCHVGNKTLRVHPLILSAFAGPRPEGLDCAHLNGVRHDNRPGNLRWMTRKENIHMMREHGTILIGERHPQAKLTEAQARVIDKNAQGRTAQELATEYGVTRETIRRLWRRLNWADVLGAAR